MKTAHKTVDSDAAAWTCAAEEHKKMMTAGERL